MLLRIYAHLVGTHSQKIEGYACFPFGPCGHLMPKICSREMGDWPMCGSLQKIKIKFFLNSLGLLGCLWAMWPLGASEKN